MLLWYVVAHLAVAHEKHKSSIVKELHSREHNKDVENQLIRSLLVWNRDLTPRDRLQKFCTITSNPFAFLRGTNHQYFRDMRRFEEMNPRLKKYRVLTWIQGDLHVDNYGAFETASGDIAYNINDFDEAVIADFQYDLWRFTISLLLSLDARKFSSSQTNNLIEEFLYGYLDEVALAADGFQRTTFTANTVTPPMATFLRKAQRSNNRKKMLDKWAPRDASTGHRRFNYEKSKGKLSQPSSGILRLFKGEGIREYYASLTVISRAKMPFAHLAIKDVAERNLAGTGSLGAGRYYILVEGPTKNEDDDVILDVKEQGRPAPFYYLGNAFMRDYIKNFGDNDAVRHNVGLLSLLREADPFLGYFRQPKMNDTYSVRQRSPWKKTIDFHNYKYADILLLVNQYGQIIGADHTKAANAKITRINNTFTGNYCPFNFAAKMQKNLNLVASVPQRAQRSKEVDEFIATVKSVTYAYANRTRADFKIFRDFAHENLDLTQCNVVDPKANGDDATEKSRSTDNRELPDADLIVFASGDRVDRVDAYFGIATLLLAYIAGVSSMAVLCFVCGRNREPDEDAMYYLSA
eukprot:GEMP01036966.1.p1 GENE.GEMP01036966.1~~GEMP01036966.1.p1  ORF type:complete len:578 (+),score=106.24 GEMP01036966.1:76-1809(+)